jgi:hypothetical protein
MADPTSDGQSCTRHKKVYYTSVAIQRGVVHKRRLLLCVRELWGGGGGV